MLFKVKLARAIAITDSVFWTLCIMLAVPIVTVAWLLTWGASGYSQLFDPEYKTRTRAIVQELKLKTTPSRMREWVNEEVSKRNQLFDTNGCLLVPTNDFPVWTRLSDLRTQPASIRIETNMSSTSCSMVWWQGRGVIFGVDIGSPLVDKSKQTGKFSIMLDDGIFVWHGTGE